MLEFDVVGAVIDVGVVIVDDIVVVDLEKKLSNHPDRRRDQVDD